MASAILAQWCGVSDGGGDRIGTSRQHIPVASERAEPHATHDPDRVLLDGIRTHTTEALDTLMTRYSASLWRFAHGYVRDRMTANEIVQDVFVAVWELGPHWQVTGTVRGYLYASVRNRALNVRKHDARMYDFARRSTGEEEIPAMGEPLAGADARLLADEQRAMLTRAVRALPTRWQQAVVLRIEDQLEYHEIADALGISSGAARKLVERAQRELRRVLAPYLER